MWKEFLNQSRTERKFENTPVIVLGRRHSGKRSLIDTLFEISKTTVYNKRFESHSDTNRMKLMGLTPIVDYAYLNVLDLTDLDNRTNVVIQEHIDKHDYQIFSLIEQPKVLKKAIVIIMLDFSYPWAFMEELDGWINFLYELQKHAGFTITELEQMAQSVSKYYKRYKQPQLDQTGKAKKYFSQITVDEQQFDIPLPDGVLTNNIRLPLIICVNKCDLQMEVLGENSEKVQIILYHLRQFCVRYGGTLVYTSIKNNSNLNTLYEYVLHRAYRMPLRFKHEIVNQHGIFIPFGFDNVKLITDSILNLDVSRSYALAVPCQIEKKVMKEEIEVEDDAQFFKKYISVGVGSNVANTVTGTTSQRNTEVIRFFEKLLNNQQSTKSNQGKQKE